MTVEWLVAQKVGFRKPKQWYEVPCVSVCKTGVTFNQQFVDSYNSPWGSYLQVGIDRENKKLLFRTATEDDIGAFKVSRPGSGAKVSGGKVSAKQPSQSFNDAVGKSYRASLNPAMRIIEVDLTTPI